jgi:hypothetical protein
LPVTGCTTWQCTATTAATATTATTATATASTAAPVKFRRGSFVFPLVVAYATAAYPADDTAPDAVSCENMNKREGRTLKKKI